MVRKSAHPDEGAELKQLWQQLGRHTCQTVDMLRAPVRETQRHSNLSSESLKSPRRSLRAWVFLRLAGLTPTIPIACASRHRPADAGPGGTVAYIAKFHPLPAQYVVVTVSVLSYRPSSEMLD